MPNAKTRKPRRLKVVAKPGPGRLNFIAASARTTGTLMNGPGDLDMACGGCGALLIEGLGSHVEGFVLQCPSCKKWNQA